MTGLPRFGESPAGRVIGGGGIPFNAASVEGREIDYMRMAVESGHSSADGPFTAAVSRLLAEETSAVAALLTTSCTAALEMSAMLLDVGEGDTVVVPSFGFVTTALAFSRAGARILFCDIEPDTLGLDPDHLESLMDHSVKAVVPIHYAGVAGHLERIIEILHQWPMAHLVEDNAHGLFGRYRGEPLGSFGRFSTLSFHETKNFTCGEGGALLINSPTDLDRAKVIYHKGTNRSAFLLGQVDKYSWQDTGSSFGLSDVLAAYLFGQLEQRKSIMERRRRLFDHYASSVKALSSSGAVRVPVVPSHSEQAYHMFYLLMSDRDSRNRVLEAMRADGVHATFHYVPLHSSPQGRRVAAREVDCPVTDDVSSRLLRLPFYTSMSASDADRVVESFMSAVEDL